MSDLITNQVENKEIEKTITTFNFTLTCPHCQTTLTPNDFDSNHFTIAHLQSYFSQKESEYKTLLRQQLELEITSLPAYQTLQKENQELKLIVEGYKLGTTKSSKTKGEELEKYAVEKLQEVYNGTDTITKITHVGTKADISQIIQQNQQTIGTIIYEVKNDPK
ncbi:11983_t:CDS:1 [Diversispora eburnea]|uniref:11983_t:CDS:1 n=1 Tax=Diversispora eburnea TaxID=1213867 RepID=A0A9N9D9I6_9GLOM|nr:11983_t:CDS:1 [Diversispora eburnea]